MDAKQVRGMMEAYASIYEKKGDCVDKKDKGMHNCAKKVCHEQYGEGETIFGQHAVPDENGFVSHYNVQFEHGIVENVSVEELEIITEGHHPEHVEHEGEILESEVFRNRRPFSDAGEYPMRDAMRDAGMHEGPYRPRPNAPIRKAKKKPTTQMAGYEPEGEILESEVFRNRRPFSDAGEYPMRDAMRDAGMHEGPYRPRPNAPIRKASAKKSTPQKKMAAESVDVFDVIKGYLIDEGYVDNEESALAIMTNMSEEWKSEIIEGSCMGGKKKKKKSGY